MALSLASGHSLWKVVEERPPVPKLSDRSVCNQTSPFHRGSLKSTFDSRLNNTVSAKTARYTTPIAMGVKLEEAVKAERSPEVDFPDVLEFTIPPESLVGFEADYEKVSAAWPEDLATTGDYAKFEQFVNSAHALVRRWLPEEVVFRVENFMHDPADPPALVIRGLPIDKDLPPTERNAHVKKTGKCVSETWLVGIARILGQPFMLSFLRGSRDGMGLLVRDLYTTADQVDLVGAEGSRKILDFHLDFFQVQEHLFPHIIAFIGLRPDATKKAKTLLCNNRKLYGMLDRADIDVLRAEKITWAFGGGGFSWHIIEGPENNPKINVFEENLPELGGFEKVVRGSPEAVAAYRRVKDFAASTRFGVWLDAGDVLLLNQKKASHGRSSYEAKYDGHDRWMQKTFVNRGGFWETGRIQWPNRTLPYP